MAQQKKEKKKPAVDAAANTSKAIKLNIERPNKRYIKCNIAD